MPWRDQLKLGWKIIRWLYWPAGWPVWANIVIWICTAVVLVCIATGNLWGIVGVIVVAIGIGVVMTMEEMRR